MKINEYIMKNIGFFCTELECEKTGIKLQRIQSRTGKITVQYVLIDDTKEYTIPVEVFEIIKSLFV